MERKFSKEDNFAILICFLECKYITHGVKEEFNDIIKKKNTELHTTKDVVNDLIKTTSFPIEEELKDAAMKTIKSKKIKHIRNYMDHFRETQILTGGIHHEELSKYGVKECAKEKDQT